MAMVIRSFAHSLDHQLLIHYSVCCIRWYTTLCVDFDTRQFHQSFKDSTHFLSGLHHQHPQAWQAFVHIFYLLFCHFKNGVQMKIKAMWLRDLTFPFSTISHPETHPKSGTYLFNLWEPLLT